MYQFPMSMTIDAHEKEHGEQKREQHDHLAAFARSTTTVMVDVGVLE